MYESQGIVESSLFISLRQIGLDFKIWIDDGKEARHIH